MSHLLSDHPDWPNAMTTPTPMLTEQVIMQLQRDLAAAQDNRQYTCEAHRDEVKKGGRCVWCDLNVAHEELNTQAHELERLLNELSAAQERIREFEEASAGLTRNQVGLLNSLAHANERAQAAEARAEANERAMQRIEDGLRKAGATLPAPEVTGTIEGSMNSGLCIALCLVVTEREAIAEGKP